MRQTTIAQPPANTDGTCAYPECNNIRPKGKRKWCSSECGQLSFWERNWEGLRLIAFFRDKFKCVKCNYPVYINMGSKSYLVTPDIIENSRPMLPEEAQTDWDFAFMKLNNKYGDGTFPHIWSPNYIKSEDEAKWWQGHYEEISPLIRRADIDHINPIFKGGDPMDHHNLQTLCIACHKIKTKKDVTIHKEKKEMEIDPNQTSLSRFNWGVE